MASLYEKLTAAGIEVSNWQSDLYFPVTEQTRAIVAECLSSGELKSRPSVFASNITGLPTYEAPFMFDPFWQNRSK